MAFKFEQAKHLLSRILAAEDFVPSDEMTEDMIREAKDLDPSDASRILATASDYSALSDADRLKLRSVIHAIHYLAKGVHANAALVGLSLDNICNAGKTGFLIPYLQQSFKSWQYNRLIAFYDWQKGVAAGGDISLATFLSTHADYSHLTTETFLSPDTYVSVTRGTGSTTGKFLKALLGDNYTTAARVVRSQKSDSWSFFRRFYRPTVVQADPLAALAEVASDDSVLQTLVEDSFALLEQLNKESPNLELPEELFTQMKTGAFKEKLAERIKALFDSYGTPPDKTTLRKLIGARKHAPEQIIDEMVGGYALLYREIHKMRLAGAIGADEVDTLLEKFLQIQGSENFFEMLLRQVQHEHGYIFEQLITFNYLRAGFDPDMLVIQSRIGDKCGPDLLAISLKRLDGATRDSIVARIIQMKSYKDINAILRASQTGEAVAQATSDVRRILREGLVQDKDGAEMVGLIYDSVIDFKIDWSRLEKDAFGARISALIDLIPDSEPLKATIKAMDPATILYATDKDVLAVVKDAFYKLHVSSKVDDINSALAGYEDEWIDLFLKRSGTPPATKTQIISALTDEFKLSDAWDGTIFRQKFYNVLDKAKRGEDIEAALRDIYRGTFNLAEGKSITVTADLVDALADTITP